MTDDLTAILRQWAFQREEFNVRVIEGHDGRPLLQIRVELGVLQLEVEGRPDGLKPEGHHTLLECIQARTDQSLSTDEIGPLRDEIILFEFRAQTLQFLGNHAAASRDADHMLAASRLLVAAADSDDRREASQLLVRKSLTIRARAAAQGAAAANRNDLAKLAIESGLSELREMLSPQDYQQSNEVQLLEGMKQLLVPKLPSSQRAELASRIQAAVDAENYELAAILRDELRLM